MRYYFDWDPNKAKSNRKKHGISFEQASAIFLDPRMIAVFDSEHSEHEADGLQLELTGMLFYWFRRKIDEKRIRFFQR